MSKLKVLSSALAELHTIEAVTRCSKHEAINSDNTLYFEMLLSSENKDWINDTNLIGIDGDYFDIAHYRAEANQRGELTVSVDCEHVSYRLNDPQFDEEYFAATGTPTEILTAILSGTGFTVGSVEFSGTHTYSAQEKMSRRAILVQFTEYLGGELLFCGFTVSILTQRGSTTAKNLTAGRNITIISKDVDKTQRDEHDNPITAYECELIEPMPLELGDVVTLDYDTLGINISLRIVSITTNPYNSAEVSFSVSNTVPAIEDEAYEIKTSTVGKDKLYNGCRIGPEYGFEAVRSDKKARAFFKSDGFSMQSGDGSGENWNDRLYFDPLTGQYVFKGTVIVNAGDVSDLFMGIDSDINLLVDEVDTLDGAVVKKDAVYNGVRIGPTYGFEAVRSDKKARAYFRSDGFKMQSGDGSGSSWEDRLFFDPVSGTYKFIGTVYINRLYAGSPSAPGSYVEMSETGLKLFNASGQLKAEFSFTSDGYDYPFLGLGSGTGDAASKGLFKKFSNGLWIGNSAPADVNGAFVPQTGYSGFFVNFTEHKVYVVNGTDMQNVYTGEAIAKFGG